MFGLGKAGVAAPSRRGLGVGARVGSSVRIGPQVALGRRQQQHRVDGMVNTTQLFFFRHGLLEMCRRIIALDEDDTFRYGTIRDMSYPYLIYFAMAPTTVQPYS